MSDVRIRYGDASELDNFDPMGCVFDDQNAIGGIQYLIFNPPTYSPTASGTVLEDETGTARDYVKNAYLGDGSSAIECDFVSGILTGTIAYYSTDGSTWIENVSIPAGWISGTDVTIPSGYYVKGISIKDDGTEVAFFKCEETEGQLVWDASGNENHAWTQADLNATASEVIWSYSDWEGYKSEKTLFVDFSNVTTSVVGTYTIYTDDTTGYKWSVDLTAGAYPIVGGNLRLTGAFANRLFFDFNGSNQDNVINGSRIRITINIASNPNSRTIFGRYFDGSTFTNVFAGTWTGNRTFTFTLNYGSAANRFLEFFSSMASTAEYIDISDITVKVISHQPLVDTTGVTPKYADPLEFTGKAKFTAYRKDMPVANFNLNTALIPASGSIAGATITDKWGTAEFTVSGNALACTSAGTCAGIKLDTGNWYTFSEGYFGIAELDVYDASGSGVNLTISGQSVGQTWGTAFSNVGYDWPNLYGGHLFQKGARRVFVPHIVDTTTPVVSSVTGYSLLKQYESGRFVIESSKWLLASGFSTPYRSELDSHIMGFTSFTNSKGHYIREKSSEEWDRIVINPDTTCDGGNTELDYYPDSVENAVAVTYQIADINNLDQIGSSYSKEINLPASAQNNDRFDYIYDPNNGEFFSIKQEKDCEIYADGVEILRGKGKVNIVQKKDIATGYKLSVLGDNYNLFRKLDAVQLSDLSLGTFTINPTNVSNSWAYTAASGVAVFAPFQAGQLISNTAMVEDLPPSFFVQNLISKGFAAAGIAWDSDWFSSDYAKRLVMPFTGNWGLSDGQVATISGNESFVAEGTGTFGQNINVDQVYYLDVSHYQLTQISGSGVWTAPDGQYSCQTASYQKFTYVLQFNWRGNEPFGNPQYTNGIIDLEVGLEVNGKPLNAKTVTIKSNSGYTFKETTVTIETDYVRLDNSSIIKPYFKVAKYTYIEQFLNSAPTQKNGTVIDGTTATAQIGYGYLSNEIASRIPEGYTLTLADYVPDLTVYDLLKGIARMFNLHFYFSPQANEVKFEPYPSFYSGNKDWSDKWNQDRDVEYTMLTDRLTRFIEHKYKDDQDDLFLTEYKENQKDENEYASYEYVQPSNYRKNEDGQETTIIENDTFAPTIEKQLNGVVLPHMKREDLTFDFVPRILYYQGEITGFFTLFANAYGKSNIPSTYSSFPRLAFSYRQSGSENWQSLSFDTFNDSFGQRVGLFDQYYSQKYDSIRDGITAKYYINLTPADIANLDFQKIYRVDDSDWVINRIIDFNPLNTEPTQVEFLKWTGKKFYPSQKPFRKYDLARVKASNPYDPNKDRINIPDGLVSSGVSPDPIFQPEVQRGLSYGNNNEGQILVNAFMFGEGLQANNDNQFIVGEFNDVSSDALFQVGAGVGSGSRANALELVRPSGQGLMLKVDDFEVMHVGNLYTAEGGVTVYSDQGNRYSELITMIGSGTSNASGTLSGWFTTDGTSSGDAIFSIVPHFLVTTKPTGEVGQINDIVNLTVSGFEITTQNSGGVPTGNLQIFWEAKGV